MPHAIDANSVAKDDSGCGQTRTRTGLDRIHRDIYPPSAQDIVARNNKNVYQIGGDSTGHGLCCRMRDHSSEKGGADDGVRKGLA